MTITHTSFQSFYPWLPPIGFLVRSMASVLVYLIYIKESKESNFRVNAKPESEGLARKTGSSDSKDQGSEKIHHQGDTSRK